MITDNWTAIFTTNQLYQAELVKEMLQENDIETVVMNQQDSSYKFGLISVMIHRNDLEKATEIINSLNGE